VTRVCAGALIALGVVFVSACTSEPASTGSQPTGDTPPAAAHPEQALIDDLVLANRMLAKELGILDTRGHTSARSQINPNHYFMPRFLSPGAVTADDIIENDLDSNAVDGPRNDQARETHLHGQIYQARPDVMAIVHSHTPEFVAFAMSSVPLWYGENRVPVFDIRPVNDGRPGIIGAPGLGRAMAETLGDREAVLLWGHGVAVTGRSLPELVTRADDLRDTARLQQAVKAIGATWKTPMRRVTESGSRDVDRAWAYMKELMLDDAGGQIPAAQPPPLPRPADPDEGARADLVYANRILASESVGALDAFGHVSVRSPSDPDSYFIAPDVSAGVVTASDIVRRNMNDAGDPQLSMHDEVYKARPDVMAIVYAHTPEVIALTEGAVQLRPVVNAGSFLSDGFPVFDVGRLDPEQPILANPALGRSVADALGDSRGVLLTGHGFVLTSSSLYQLMYGAYAMRMNALIQQQAIALGGTVAHLDDVPVTPPPPPPVGQPSPPQLGPPEGRDWIYWRDGIDLD
jgi:HCOMODA/2-hydroxy-3-carboxy-muconic semialdehyde decarboxylase